jgi:hypothetical protein
MAVKARDVHSDNCNGEGGRVLHRLLLDHPDAAERAALLDLAPTAMMYMQTRYLLRGSPRSRLERP